MNKKILISVICVACVLCLGLIWFIHNKDDDADYTEYSQDSLYVEYDNVKVSESSNIEGALTVDNITSTDEYVIAEFNSQGYSGSLSHDTLDTLGEGEIPDLALEYNASEWWCLATAEGLHYAVIVDGEVIIE